MFFFEETKYFLLFLIFFISVVSFWYYKYNDIFCNNQINLQLFFKKKRDQKELLISEGYKELIPVYKNNYYGIVGCLIKDNSF